jgi:hypothetical protein
LFQNFSVGFFSFFFVLARIGALSVGSILGVVLLLLWLADVPDKGFDVGIIHITMGQFLPTPDMFRIRGLDRSFVHSVQSLQVSLFIPREEVSESFISSHPCVGIPPFSEANHGKLQIVAEINRVSGRPLS